MPVVLSATCATIEGIGRDWTVAGTPTQPRGIVGFFGTTTGLFEAAEMRSALCRGTTACLFSDSGGLGVAAEAGRLEYYAQFDDLIEYYSWTCLGDPEMQMWTDTPREIIVGHNMYFTTGICTASVYVQHNSTPVAGALVCMMAKYDTTFYDYGYTDDNGGFRFIDTLHIPGDSVYITVTGHNWRPYFNARPVFFAGGPYVQLHTFRLLDSLGGNGDGIANPAEDIEIPSCLMNWGNATAYGVSATIEKIAPDTFFTLYDTIKYFGNIAPYESIYIYPDGYNAVIDTNAPDLHEIGLRLRIRDSGSLLWTSDFGFANHAPLLSYHDHYFNDHVKYTPIGDTGQLYVELLNTGSSRAENVIGRISCDDSLITLIDSTVSFGIILPDSIGYNQAEPFVIANHPNTPIGYSTTVTVDVVSGVYAATYNFAIHMGQKDYLVWDPDPNHSSGPIIHTLLDSLEFYGDYTTDFPYGFLSLYKSIFVCTGVYPYNYPIGDTSQTGYEIGHYLQTQGGKTYLEGGDIWYSALVSHGYDFGQLFGIDPVNNSIGLFTGVNGCTGTFTENMAFGYTGEATMIDRIDTIGGSQLICRKANASYGCGVAANDRTVGISFELGGLVDTLAPSTRLALIDSIMDYFGVPPTRVNESQELSVVPTLSLTCHPNPFRETIYIRYMIQDAGYTEQDISFDIYDVTGRLVKSFYPESSIMNRESGFSWDGHDDLGRRLAQGIYFVHLNVKDAKTIVKTILLH
jgi:hypothetical protein